MGLTRRTFLQRMGFALTAFGFSEVAVSLLADRYQQVLAQPTRRKLALLVGINQYPEQVCDYIPARGSALNGCLTDVALQRELLIHRFGFQSSDILALTDAQATRQAIELAFRSHLIDQAHPGDVVVVHFSGLGSQVRLMDSDEVQNSFVPVDGVLPTAENPAINDLLEDTLGLLLRSLPTDHVTTVLDLSYAESGKSLQGNLRTRSRPSTPTGQRSEVEFVLQELLLNQLQTTREQVNNQWRSGHLPGVVLTAAEGNQGAMEGQWAGFSAGVLTYALTQQLWQITPSTTLQVSFSQTVGAVKQMVALDQQPRLSGQKSQEVGLMPYFLKPDSTSGADGVVTAVEDDGKTLQVWLGGLPATIAEHYGVNALMALHHGGGAANSFEMPERQPESSGSPAIAGDTAPNLPSVSTLLLQGRSRDGLIFKARLLEKASSPAEQVGQRVWEAVRVLPRNISLTVALDSTLERIERVDATSAFASIPKISAVLAGEQPADYFFGKISPTPQTLAVSLPPDRVSGEPAIATDSSPAPPSKESYGLFNPGRSVLPNTLSSGYEAIKTAVNRLTPKLRTLLAAKLLRLTTNGESSRLGVRATLELVAPEERIVVQQQTVRAPWPLPTSRLTQLVVGTRDVPTLPMGSRIRYRLHNYSDRPVYFTLLGIDSGGNAIALCPPPPSITDSSSQGSEAPFTSSAIAPSATLMLPQPTIDWVINGPVGLTETHLVFSRTPLAELTVALEAATLSSSIYRLGTLTNPLEVIYALLNDLHQAGMPSAAKIDAPADTYTLDVNIWATLSFLYQVVEA